MSNILVAMPAYNEEKYIGSIVLKAKLFTDTILVVDDGSTVDTARIARLAGALVQEHEHNQGYGAAIQSIFRLNKEQSPDCLVVMDADYQHYAEDIPLLVKPILSGDADVVVGCRKQESIPRYRKIGQAVLSLFTRLVSGSHVKDTQSGFRAYSRRAVSMLSLKQTGMAVSSEITAEAARLGLKVVEVPIRVRYDGDGSTHNPVAQGIHTMNRILSMISERRPLLFFSILGGVLMLAGFGAGIYSYNLLVSTSVPPVGTMLISALLIIVGLLATFTGIILHTVTKVLGK
jgi:glycosyltransferase involved in cell wall biosynthesis